MSEKKKLVSIVSPAYNEDVNIPLMVEEVKKSLLPLSDKYDFEYIIVNDGSWDNSWEVICEENKKDSRVKGINFSRNFGHQMALTAGLDRAKGDVVIYCDSDLQQPPSLFPKMLKLWEDGVKVVHTRRTFTDGEGTSKKLLSKLFYKFINLLSDTEIKEGFADFKLLDKEVLEKVKSMREHNRFLRGMVPWLGFKSAILEYKAGKRLHGTPWYNFSRNLEFAKTGIMSFSIKPLKYIGYFGVFLTIGSIAILFLGAVISFIKGALYFSPTFYLLVFNTLLNGLMMSALGIVALYISYIYQEVINRPLYLISDVVE